MDPVHVPIDLRALRPAHACLVGIDSDGCVFDTMELKQRRHFHPLIIRHWGLERIAPQVRQAAEFFNLHSRWRGQNRFLELLRVFRALPELPGVAEAGVPLPDTRALEAYIASGLPLGHPSLAAEVERTGDPELRNVLAWSLEVNRDIDRHMPAAPPFPRVRESLTRLAAAADVVVVSQTPAEALLKEWRLHGLDHWVRAIAGQEQGTKSEQLRLATQGRYAPERVLMIGDAPGDLEAAQALDARFYPILPGREEQSWRRFLEEDLERFLDGRYGGALQTDRIAEFEALLPARPPWMAVGMACHDGADRV